MKTENPFGEMTAEEKKNMIIERQLQMLDAFHARHAISEEDYERGVKYLQSQADRFHPQPDRYIPQHVLL